MPATKDSYRVTGRTADELTRELNFLFARFADRMDRIEGIRGTATIASDLNMQSNRVTELGDGSEDSDAARVGDLLSDGPTFTSVTTTGGMTAGTTMAVGTDLTVGGNVYVRDADGNLIHSME